jgi:hypothetical protein
LSDGQEYERVRVIVETAERTFRGYLYRPILGESYRLSDYLNEYKRPFLCLSDVSVNERGQTHRPGEKREFVAIATNAIVFLAPMQPGEA